MNTDWADRRLLPTLQQLAGLDETLKPILSETHLPRFWHGNRRMPR